MVRHSLISVFAVLALSLAACSVSVADAPDVVDSFESCVASGRPVLRSYPGRCIALDGKVYVDPLDKIPGRVKEEPKSFCKNQCGNKVCEQLVCMAEGCPCPESSESCPQDCE